jgi:molybdopterin synthase catalytic subunit
VRLFASLREAAGREWLEVDLPGGARVGDLLADLAGRRELGRAAGRCLVARGTEYVGAEARLQEGDEVAVLPPLSGGSGASGGCDSGGGGRGGPRACLVEIPIDVSALLQQVADPACGGVAMFLGTVREPNLGHRTLHIDYHAYPEMAVKVMEEIAAEAAARWEVGRIVLVHRTGRLGVGEISVAIVVAAPHRQPALDACAYLIEALKARVPIWKKETFEGGQVWIEGDMIR